MTDQAPSSALRLDREAMKADAAAVLLSLQSSERLTLLDQLVTPLLGRSLLRIGFDLCSAVIDLPDAHLEALAGLLVDRGAAYLGARPAAPLDAAELEALAAFRGAVARTWLGE
jgi:hypothetical protein